MTNLKSVKIKYKCQEQTTDPDKRKTIKIGFIMKYIEEQWKQTGNKEIDWTIINEVQITYV